MGGDVPAVTRFLGLVAIGRRFGDQRNGGQHFVELCNALQANNSQRLGEGFGDGAFFDDLLAHFYPQAGTGFAGVVAVAFVRPVVRFRPCLEVGAEVVHGEADVRVQRLQFTAGIVQGFHPREVAEQVGLGARQLEVVGGGVQHGEQFGKFVGDGFWQSFHGGAPGVVCGWVWLVPVVGGSAAAVSARAVTPWRIV